jgi:hypothetical protein
VAESLFFLINAATLLGAAVFELRVCNGCFASFAPGSSFCGLMSRLESEESESLARSAAASGSSCCTGGKPAASRVHHNFELLTHQGQSTNVVHPDNKEGKSARRMKLICKGAPH